jgi:hypothetical protein
MKQTFQTLYELRPADHHWKLKIWLSFEMSSDTYSDHWALSTVALLSNIFGIMGLFLGYSILDIHTRLEVALTCISTKM